MKDFMTTVPTLGSDLGLLEDALTDAIAHAADRRAFCKDQGGEMQAAEAQHQAYERLRYAVRAAQRRNSTLDMVKVWEYGETVERCGAYSKAHPTTPLRDNPHDEEAEQAHIAAFGAPWVLYHCDGCRLVTPRLDPSADFRTACCHAGITVDWEPDWIDKPAGTIATQFTGVDLVTLIRAAVALWNGVSTDDLSDRQCEVMENAAFAVSAADNAGSGVTGS